MPHNKADYAYIIGRLRALETKSLTTNVVERMIEAKTADEAFRVLNDISFLSGSIGEDTVNDFQKVLNRGVQKMVRLIYKMSPYPEVVNFLMLKYDFHNLKVVLKARLTEKGYADVSHALIGLGTLTMSEWEHFALEGQIPPLTDYLSETIKDASLEYEKTNDPQVVDLIVDKHYLEEMLDLSKKFGSDLTLNYIKKLIDLTNLKSFVRSKELNKDENYYESMLLHGGFIPTFVFVDSFKKGYEELRQVLERKMHGEDSVKVLDEFLKEGTVLAAEKKMGQLLQEFMDESKKMSFGPEPVLAYFWRFETHMQILRIILVGKLNMLTAEDIHKNVLAL